MGKFFLIIIIITLLIRSINFFKSIIQFSGQNKRRGSRDADNNSSGRSDDFSDTDIQDADFEEID